MKEENGSSEPQPAVDPFGGKFNNWPFSFLSAIGMAYGIVAVGVLSTSPLGRTIAIYTALGFGVLGIVPGARYGFYFNIVNHCKGGKILWAFIGGIGGVALGVLVVVMIAAIIGTVAGFVVGWGVGSFLTRENRGLAPLVGAMAGAVAQAGWSEPTTVLKAAAIGGVCGVLAGSLFFFICVALGYFVLRRAGQPHAN